MQRYLWDNVQYMKYIDNFLNKITMYRVVLYGLSILVFIGVILGFLGLVSYSGVSIIISFFAITIICYLWNVLFSKLFGVQTNIESAWITGIILSLILAPLESFSGITIYLVVGALAMGSKYLLAIEKKHIFNPAALSIFIAGFFGSSVAYWWVGSYYLLIPVVILGVLVLRKVRRFQMFFCFAGAAILSILFSSYIKDLNLLESLKFSFVSGPILFFGAIMLTEPLTTPAKRNLQIIYGVLVGVIYGLDFHFGSLYNTPELALIVGNIFAFLVSPRDRLILKLLEKNNLSSDVYEFVWEPNKKLAFEAGQYLEWTLGHGKPDTRGNRRYFTIASSPTEDNIKLGIKTYENPSSFKNKLVSLKIGSKISAGSLSGEFILPKDTKKKMVWIAGGIGITPFRSMAQYLIDKKEKRNAVLFFSNKTSKDIVYKDIFEKAKDFGLKTIHVCNTKLPEDTDESMKYGFIDEEMIKKEVPDYKDRVFYISGPHGMVNAFENTLKKIGVPNSQIKIDFFPGFV